MHRLRALGAAIVLAGLVIGFPLALAVTVGDPLRSWAAIKAGDMSNTSVIAIMAAVAYLAWAQFAYAVVVELVSALRRSPVPRRIPFVLAGQQNAARALVGAAVLVATMATVTGNPLNALAAPAPARTPATPSASAPARPAHPPHPGVTRSRQHGNAAAAAQHQQAPGATGAGQPSEYTVPDSGGDSTFWALAVKHYGHGDQWSKIWAINEGRRQADGTVMTTPRLLRPGWTVLIPADATPPKSAQPTKGRHAAEQTVTVTPGDTLSHIGDEHGVTDWHAMWDANRDRFEPHGRTLDSPDLIIPGWKVTVPGHDAAAPHVTTPPAVHHDQPAAPTHDTNHRSGPGTAARPTVRVPNRPHHDTGSGATVPSASTPSTQSAPARPMPPQTTRRASTPAQPAPAHSVSARSAERSHAAAASHTSVDSVIEEVLGAGVGLLAAGGLGLLLMHRRRQFRRRTPGRVVAAGPPELAPVEQALQAFGEPGMAQVAFLDAALRTLSLGAGELPDVLAARMTVTDLSLVFADTPDSAPPAPWRADNGSGRWVVDRSAALPERAVGGEHRPLAPYPCLVSVGVDDDGAQWLLDLERVQSLTLTGDRPRGLDLARYIAAELAANRWSDHLLVTLAGFGEELVEANTARIAFSTDVQATAAQLVRDVDANIAAATAAGVDVLDGRRGGTAGDVWMPHVLLAVATTEADIAALDHLASRCTAHPGRTAVAVVTQLGQDGAGSERVAHLDDRGNLHLPFLDITVRAQQLPQWLAADMATAIAVARDGDVDMPAPSAAVGGEGSEFLDACGAIQAAHTVPRIVRVVHGQDAQPVSPASTLLPASAQVYLTATATTADDVAALSPIVPTDVQAAVMGGDPGLDADLAAWHDRASRVARLALFGDVTVTAFGRPPAKTVAFYSEVVAYLALHPGGVSPERFAADLWPHKAYTAADGHPRQAASTARNWLGDHPVSGQSYLARAVGGVDRYSLDGVLVDVELFRRLRARAQARGAAGMTDLIAALALVTGQPLHNLRKGGWTWLPAGEQDLFLAMVVDVAHIVATDALAKGDVATAETAARTALRAGDTGDIAMLDMVAVCDATGRDAEAAAFVQRVLDNHEAEVEEDLPPRTYEVLRRREWLPVAS